MEKTDGKPVWEPVDGPLERPIILHYGHKDTYDVASSPPKSLSDTALPENQEYRKKS